VCHLTHPRRGRTAGLAHPANGPFPPGSAGYLEDTGYPKLDQAAAQQDLDICLQKTATGDISFDTTNDPSDVEYVHGIAGHKLPDGRKGIGLGLRRPPRADPDVVRRRQVRRPRPDRP
jgi:hypothetical protein